jgi:MSHA biogenesis protein MshO
MRRTIPSRASRQGGFSLIELVVAIVVVAIIVAVVGYFLLPLRQAVDLTVRAELTDAADNALQRIGREVRLALPNSVRIPGGSGQVVEFLPVVTAGRYRAEGYGAGAPVGTPCTPGVPESDRLLFGAPDTCFKTIGTVGGTITSAHRLVLNNYGENFPGQNAYEAAGAVNWRQIANPVPAAGSNDRINFTSAAALDRALHDSPGRRYYVVADPVSFSCDLGTGRLTRHEGYGAPQPAQPTGGALGAGNLLAGNVSRCVFEYQPNVAPGIGVVTLRLGLSKALSGGGMETIELVHAIHVRNLP